jgi:hypothetical protein
MVGVAQHEGAGRGVKDHVPQAPRTGAGRRYSTAAGSWR